ncbi:hypothetical protein VCUG_00947 [Vavraia culicis subsp. floridensis]|uniref:PUM-HD domain-containing protein n=1 Tax=Vavraia culicis (isolate floridensis) TaxID=948595 RepID=L2GVG8_VAVCU|nr:uncharacterized protein VCUG_00947 [Vavraia culicis subsp. floridensis]ELA47624.1 hypothetical protein VCUG_00947 [Vavraia culicis subsp. floridensis]
MAGTSNKRSGARNHKRGRFNERGADSKKMDHVGEASSCDGMSTRVGAGTTKKRNTKECYKGGARTNEVVRCKKGYVSRSCKENDIRGSCQENDAHDDSYSECTKKTKKYTESKSMQKSKTNELIDQCKKDWEISRRKKVAKSEREDANKRIVKILKGHFYQVLRKRTGSKIVQTLFKYGNATLKDQIFDEIYRYIPELCQCSFSIFFLQKLVDSKYLGKVFEMLKKEHRKILTSRVGAFYFDEVYQRMKVVQKGEMIKEIMGSEAKIFYGGKPLEDIPKEKFNFEAILQKMMDKGLTNLEIMHDLIYYHLMHFNDADERRVFMKGLSLFFVDLLHTQRGKSIAFELLRTSENKKKIFKKTGEYISKMVENAFVHDVLLELIQNGDDKYVLRYILKPIKTGMDVFLNTDNFDLFLLKLIDAHKFEVLKNKFMKAYKKNEKVYALRYEKVVGKLGGPDLKDNEGTCAEAS